MISGAHVVLYTRDAAADRAFLRDVLGFGSVDSGGGWLIFALPPAELGVHPSDANNRHELFLTCDNVRAEIAALERKGVRCSPVHEEQWGWLTTISLPGGGELGLYQPKHPMAVSKDARAG